MQLASLIIGCLSLALLIGYGVASFLTAARSGTQDAKEAFYMGEIQKLLDKMQSKDYLDYAQAHMVETPEAPVEEPTPEYSVDGLA